MSSHLAADLSQLAIPGGAMTIAEFCNWARIGRTMAYAEIKAGRLVLRKAGAKSLISRDAAEAWLHSLPVVATAN
ncbi:DNA-binding protein [Tardiphaga sp. 172_B4_N1_3]|uniref:DNA-binding protein n=1 Tax=Tardiphaga sp. 172_B4_N1_3 TaxID=3240787 RepID=UPI003F8B5ECB